VANEEHGPTHTVAVSGVRSVSVGLNSGIVQTGDAAWARALSGAVDPPSMVDAPITGLVGLPKPPSRAFVGRQQQLAELDRLVRSGAGVVTQAVHGLGGVGKSELALQYVTRRRSSYRVVWWIVADSPEAIGAGLAELAYRGRPRRLGVGHAAADAISSTLSSPSGATASSFATGRASRRAAAARR
jgi:hypothetical protein